MADTGRGRGRKGTTRKETAVTVVDTLPDATGTTRFSQTPLEGVQNLENKYSERQAVKSFEAITADNTPFAPLDAPVATNVASTSVADRGLERTPMGRRRPLQVVQTNRGTPSSPSPSVKASMCEDRGRDVAVQQICDAIDAEVQVRSEAIRAIASTQLLSITSLLRLLLSRLPPDVQNMPLLEYLKSCPNIVSKEMDDGSIQLQKASPAENLLDEPNSLFNTPAFGPNKISVSQVQSFESEELSWPEYHAKLQASGHLGGYPASGGTHFQEYSAVSLKTGLLPGTTPKTMRIPKLGEVLLSLNGSPLGQFGFTPGPNIDKRTSARKLPETRVMRSTTKRSLGQFGFTPGPYMDNRTSARKRPEPRVTRATTERPLRDL